MEFRPLQHISPSPHLADSAASTALVIPQVSNITYYTHGVKSGEKKKQIQLSHLLKFLQDDILYREVDDGTFVTVYIHINLNTKHFHSQIPSIRIYLFSIHMNAGASMKIHRVHLQHQQEVFCLFFFFNLFLDKSMATGYSYNDMHKFRLSLLFTISCC